MWRNDTKCKYMFMLPLNNLARKGLITQARLYRQTFWVNGVGSNIFKISEIGILKWLSNSSGIILWIIKRNRMPFAFQWSIWYGTLRTVRIWKATIKYMKDMDMKLEWMSWSWKHCYSIKWYYHLLETLLPSNFSLSYNNGFIEGHEFLIFGINSMLYLEPHFYLQLSKVTANERRYYLYNDLCFSNYLKPCPVIVRKGCRFAVLLGALCCMTNVDSSIIILSDSICQLIFCLSFGTHKAESLLCSNLT